MKGETQAPVKMAALMSQGRLGFFSLKGRGLRAGWCIPAMARLNRPPVTSVHINRTAYLEPLKKKRCTKCELKITQIGKEFYCPAAVIATYRIGVAGKLSRLEISGHGAHMGLNWCRGNTLLS